MDPIAKLAAGFRDLRDGRFQEQRATYEALVDPGEKPEVALIACSDSRVDPAIVLQAARCSRSGCRAARATTSCHRG